MNENKVAQKFDVFHYQGPIVFFAIAIIVVIQIVQLLHYDIEQIYNLRVSLNSIFAIERPGEDVTSSALGTSRLYLESVTSMAQFEGWLEGVVNHTTRPRDGASILLFANKTVTLGDIVLIKYRVNKVACKTQVPGNKSCIASSYSDETKGSRR